MLKEKTKLQAKELPTSEMLCAYGILANMYPELGQTEYESIIKERIEEGYRMAGVYQNDKLICVAGFWIGVRFYCGKFIQIDNMVTAPEFRRAHAGKELVNWVKELAHKENCKKIILDSYVENFEAHRFFLREGFIIRGYHLNYSL